MKGCKLKESDMFLPIKNFFEDEGYTIYAEVPHDGRTADIVAVKGGIITIIETKISMNIKLLEQVFEWRYKAHYVYAAVPRKTEISNFARDLLKNAGIGLMILDIDISSSEPFCSRIYKCVNAKLFRKIGNYYNGDILSPIRWDQHIIPEHALNISGVKHANIRVSRYKLMMDHVRNIVTQHNDGISIDEIVNSIDTYYVNPKIGLYNALKNYESDWCEFFRKPGERKTCVRIKPINQTYEVM